MKTALCCLLLLINSTLYSQSDKIETLKSELETTSNDSIKVDILNDLAWIYMSDRINEAPECIAQAIKIAKGINYKKGEAEALQRRGTLYRINGFYGESFKDFYGSLGISKELNFKEGMASSYANLGLLAFERKEFKDAIKFHEKALEIKLIQSDSGSLLFTLNDLCEAHIEVKEYDEALNYASQSLELTRHRKDTSGMGFAYFNLANVIFLNNDLENAQEMVDYSIDLCQKSKNYYILIKAYNLKSKICLDNGNPNNALTFANKSLELSTKFNFTRFIQNAYLLISKAYAANENYQTAYAMHLNADRIKDSLNSQQLEQSTAFIAFQNDLAAKQKVLEAKYETSLINQRYLIISFSGGLILLTIIFIIVYFKNNQLKKAYEKLSQANRDITSQKEEIQQQKEKIQIQASKLAHVNSSKDKIFNIISHDLKSPIASLKGILSIPNRQDLSDDQFNEFKKSLDERVNNVSNTLNNLLTWSKSQMGGLNNSPIQLELYPLLIEKKELYQPIAHKKGVDLNFDVPRDLKVFADPDLIKIVAQNLLGNAIKFTNPNDKIDISAHKIDRDIQICIKDTGIGISEEDQQKLFDETSHFTSYGTDGEKGTGIGLLLSKEIIIKSGGRIWVESEKGKGSSFCFTIPSAN